MQFNYELAERLAEAPGIAGREEAVREIVVAEMRPLVDNLTVDTLGNVIGTTSGHSAPRVMLAAHMDEIGFMVKFIDDRGFVRLQNIGSFDPRVLPAQRVRVHTSRGEALLGVLQFGNKPIHLLTQEEIKVPKLQDVYVDLGLSAPEVRQQVDIGDMVTLDRTLERAGHTITGKSLDDRISVFVMIEVLRSVGQHEAEIVAVATTQEEVGLRGAQTAAFGVNPDIGIALDVTVAADTPGVDAIDQVSKLGHGVAIKMFDSSHIPNHRLVRHFRSIAEQHGIPHQLEVLPCGGTDGSALQRARAGAPAITISIPTRYLHTVNEMACVDDIMAEIQLVARYLEQAHRGDYTFG
jgi:putative aminopeptidase FrvX